MDRSARPDDGSPTRLIATMVGIVGILLLGSLAWTAVGALFSALGGFTSSVSLARPPAGSVVAVGTPTPISASPTIQSVLPTPTPQPTPRPSATSVPLTATPEKSGRAPWVLLPQPAPDTKVAPGSLTIEARARGDAAITAIRLELDGAPLPVSLEQRSESTWRASAIVQVGLGKHTVHATVIDDQNRSGGYRWSFDVGP